MLTLADDVNVWGQFACAQAAADLWIKSGYKKGSIVLTSSMSSQIVNKGIHQVFYNSSKAAASSIVKQLAVEWADKGIRINALCPGTSCLDTRRGAVLITLQVTSLPTRRTSLSSTFGLVLTCSSHMDPKLLDWQKKDLVPLQRFSEPEEQAYMALLLLDSTMGG